MNIETETSLFDLIPTNQSNQFNQSIPVYEIPKYTIPQQEIKRVFEIPKYIDYSTPSLELTQESKTFEIPKLISDIEQDIPVYNILDRITDIKAEEIKTKEIKIENKGIVSFIKQTCQSLITKKALISISILAAGMACGYAVVYGGIQITGLSSGIITMAQYFGKELHAQFYILTGMVLNKALVEYLLKDYNDDRFILSDKTRDKLKQLGIPESVYNHTYSGTVKTLLGNIRNIYMSGFGLVTNPYITIGSQLVSRGVSSIVNQSNKETKQTKETKETEKLKTVLHNTAKTKQEMDSYIDTLLKPEVKIEPVKNQAEAIINLTHSSKVITEPVKIIEPEIIKEYKSSLIAASFAATISGLLYQGIVNPTSVLEDVLVKKFTISLIQKYIGIDKYINSFVGFLTTDQINKLSIMKTELNQDSVITEFFGILLGKKIYTSTQINKMDKEELLKVLSEYKVNKVNKTNSTDVLRKKLIQLQKERQKITYSALLTALSNNVINLSTSIVIDKTLSTGYAVYKDQVIGLLNNTDIVKMGDITIDEITALKVASQNPEFVNKYMTSKIGIDLDIKNEDPITIQAVNALRKLNLTVANSKISVNSEIVSEIQTSQIKKQIDDVLLSTGKIYENVKSAGTSISSMIKRIKPSDMLTKEYKRFTLLDKEVNDILSKIDDIDVPTKSTIEQKQHILLNLNSLNNELAIKFKEYTTSLNYVKSHLEEYNELKSVLDNINPETFNKLAPKLIIGVSNPIIKNNAVTNKLLDEMKSIKLPKELKEYMDFKFVPLIKQVTNSVVNVGITWVPGVGWYQKSANIINTAQDVISIGNDLKNIYTLLEQTKRGDTDIKIPERIKPVYLPDAKNVILGLTDYMFDTKLQEKLDMGLSEQVNMLDIIQDSLLNQFRHGLSQEEFIKDVMKKVAGEGEIDFVSKTLGL